MKSVNHLMCSLGVALMLVAGSGCMSSGPTTAQSHDDAWCGAHPKQCDNKDWCAKNPGKCSAASTGD
ncbi:MAG TPA: hypothetical protein VHW95_18445 [Steroidobacteraceae bacterium]|jgi:hypothetical protein|nr:hypothetical protein [Steroidobacteraceae bacterium]